MKPHLLELCEDISGALNTSTVEQPHEAWYFLRVPPKLYEVTNLDKEPITEISTLFHMGLSERRIGGVPFLGVPLRGFSSAWGSTRGTPYFGKYPHEVGLY